ncbi:3-dehydroquinate synthase [Segnochrobactraceae bacterium EtOH-i3]
MSLETLAPGAIERVPVDLPGREYDILIGPGLVDRVGAEIADRFPGVRVTVLTDTNLEAAGHLARARTSLEAAGIATAEIVVGPGEGAKSWPVLEKVCGDLLDQKRERGDLVVALGGGVIGDLAGFAASILRRGMRFVQVPTSLLAQVDSSVGGKTGINTAQGKNLIGAFHQPSLVLADTDVLKTLSPREFRAGYAEVVKYGLIDDIDFFARLEREHADVFAFGPALTDAIATSCRAKARVVIADETEKGERALLNLGHTFGHALEAATHLDSARLVHGEGVAIGMAQAFRFSAMLRLADPADAERVEAHLKAVGLPTRLSDVPGELPDADGLLELMAQDKKVSRGQLTFILAHGIGESFIEKDVDPAAVRAFLIEEARG